MSQITFDIKLFRKYKACNNKLLAELPFDSIHYAAPAARITSLASLPTSSK